MTQPESDDLSQLMPTLREQARLGASPGNTVALREYIKVLGERPGNVPATSAAQPGAKPRTDGLVPRAGTGRRPQRRFFTIKWRAEAPTTEDQAAAEAEAAEAEVLDPEALKDALVEQARAQRSALVQAGQRAGTGRMPRHREFAIILPPLQLEEEVGEGEEAAAAEQAAAAAEEAAIAAEEAAAALEAEAFAAEQLQQAQLHAQQVEEWDAADAPQQYWASLGAEEGVLAEHAEVVALQPANACTPGAALEGQLEGLERGGSSEAEVAAATVEQQQQEPGTSQRAQARTPGTSLYGRYTPMEGVPERLVLLATRGKGALGMGQAAHVGAATAPRSARPAGTPAGFTPLEGIPERLRAFPVLPGATRVCSNAAERPAVDSPVEGLVQEGAARRRAGSGGALLPAPAAAAAAPAEAGTSTGFGGFVPPPAPSPGALPAPAMLLEQGTGREVAAAAADVDAGGADFEDMGGDGFDDGGYDDGEPSPHSAAAGRPDSGFPLRADAAVQTGTSLAAEEAEGAAAVGGSPDAGAAARAAAEEQEEPVENGDYDAGDDHGDMYDDQGDMYNQGGDEDEADLPEASAAAERRAQRQTKNPGARLRNEHKRKSLVADPGIGRHEVLPGVRRSSRQREQPLKWWLNEKKEFGRSHKTMPTVNNVVHTVPNTPWQTVTDIKRRPAKKKRAPTPADLERALAGAEDEEGEEEQQHGQVQQQQQHEEGEDEHAPQAEEQQRQRRRPGSGGQQQAQQRRGAAGRRQAQGAAAKQPPAARGAATKKKGAAAGKKRKARR